MKYPLRTEPLSGPGTARPRNAFLSPVRPRRTEEEKRKAARERQSRYLTNLDCRGDAPIPVIASALLAALATAGDIEELKESNGIVRAMLEKLIAAGYDPCLVIRRVRKVRHRLLHEQPGDEADRKRRAARS